MANTKISQLPSATTPVVGTEVLPIVQSSTTSKVSIANLTAGRAVSASSYDATGATAPANGMFSLAAGSLAFSVSSSQIGKFLSGGGGGAFEVDDAASAGYDVRRYISVTNLNTGTAASASVFSSAFSTQANLTAFSPSHATTALANKSVLFGSNRGSNASSGTVVADFSTGTNQIQFYLGTTASPLSVAHFLGAAGSFEVSDFAVGAGYNGQRYIQVGNVSTGTSAYAWTGASALNVNAKLGAFSPSHTSTALANKSVLFGADGASGASGTAIADFSTGTNQIQFYVGTVASPTLAGTISSTGNWDFGAKTLTTTGSLTAGSFVPTSSTAPTNGMFLPNANQVGFSTASGQVAQFFASSTGGSFEVNDSADTGYNGQRYINVRNKSTGTSAYSWLGATSVNTSARVNAFSPSHTSATLANKASFYGVDGTSTSSGTILADFSTGTNQIQFYVGTTGTPVLAASIDSAGNLGLGVTPGSISASYKTFHVAGSSGGGMLMGITGTPCSQIYGNSGGMTFQNLAASSKNFVWYQDSTEVMRLDASGNLVIGANSQIGAGVISAAVNTGTSNGFVFKTTTDGAFGALRALNNAGSEKLNIQYDTTNAFMAFRTDNAERVRIDSSGLVGIGTTPSASYGMFLKTSVNGGYLHYKGTDFVWASIAGGTPTTGFSTANACSWVSKDSSTSRSINAAGTVNTNGADYAEYMTKSGDFTIAKGDVVGINAEGKLTNLFGDAVSFAVKSTDPSFVGGDNWFEEEAPKAEDGTMQLEGEAWDAYKLREEAARQLVDRIAFAGQVPVNVTGATAGQYIIPVNDNGAIKGEAVNNPTFEQYQQAVGKVIAIEQDGRARIIVKVA